MLELESARSNIPGFLTWGVFWVPCQSAKDVTMGIYNRSSPMQIAQYLVFVRMYYPCRYLPVANLRRQGENLATVKCSDSVKLLDSSLLAVELTVLSGSPYLSSATLRLVYQTCSVYMYTSTEVMWEGEQIHSSPASTSPDLVDHSSIVHHGFRQHTTGNDFKIPRF
jgi:hypothetical protein